MPAELRERFRSRLQLGRMVAVSSGAVFANDAYHRIRFDLFEPTQAFGGDAWDEDVLEPWLAANPEITTSLRQVGEPQMATQKLAAEDSWALYALSRVAELLILSRQPPKVNADDPDPWLPPGAYEQFITAIGGFSPEAHGGFHPFLHEIAGVVAADDPRAEPELDRLWWPACFVGSMLLLRGGVTVRAGAQRLDPEVASSSALYWAWRRQYRPTADLSDGWGSNSQWRTRFRRDYLLPGRLAYNVDAAVDPPPVDEQLETVGDGAISLLRHRCSTVVDHGDDAWVWDSHHTEQAPSGLAPL